MLSDVPHTSLAALPIARQRAAECFRESTDRGCGAVYIVTQSTGMKSLKMSQLFISLANASASSLKRWLPGARATLFYSRGEARSSDAHVVSPQLTGAFDHVVAWSRPVGKHLAHAWHEKTLMLVSAQQLYGKAGA